MSFASGSAETWLKEFALGDLLTSAFGWRPVSSPDTVVIVEGDEFLLEPLVERNGIVALQHSSPLNAGIPSYATRRAIRDEAARLHPDLLIVFRDALHTTQVWQWMDTVAVVPVYREHSYHAGENGAPLLRRLAEIGSAPRRPGQPSSTLPAEARAAIASATLHALLRGVRRRYPQPFRAGGAVEQRLEQGEDPGRLVRDLIEDSSAVALPRAVWRALQELTVLDPACGEGDRLLAVLDALEPVYAACLERMGAWVAELDRSRVAHRPEKLRDFRTLLARADDVRHYPSRRHFLRTQILHQNLYAVDPRPEAVESCRRRLLQPVGAGAEPEGSRHGIQLNLYVGRVEYGFSTRAEVLQSFADGGEDPAIGRRLVEEAEAVSRTRRLLRRLRVSEPAAAGASHDDAVVQSHLSSLRSELGARSARRYGSATDPESLAKWRERHRPFHLWLEFHEIVARGGFDMILIAGQNAEAGSAGYGAAGEILKGSGGVPTPRVRESHPDFRPTAAQERASMRTDPDTVVQVERGAPAYPPDLQRLLGERAPAVLTSRGKPDLLQRPLLAIFCSVRVPGDLILPTLDLARALRDAGAATIAGFQTPTERECLEFLLRGHQPVVVSPARGIAQMRLPAEWRNAIAEGRLLLVSRFSAKERRPTTRLAEARNHLVAALAERTFIVHATPGGRTYQLARQLLDWGKQVYTFEHPANADLLLLGARPIPLEASAAAEILEQL